MGDTLREVCLRGAQGCRLLLSVPGDHHRIVFNVGAQFIAPHVQFDEFIVMPNHFHAIMVINKSQSRRGEAAIAPTMVPRK